ncbi:ATP phosphoribosyltransferase [Salsipaludibacter albus]|uniref:ATP phosphoribosyltransferase n=1 Tax=Salsipaludibacter albus TaxID=2849650 RepID=UPI001EE422E2|nr:ATP phosphoribosyltransferase [Salsipaludibacter albus]MBY5163780.1 ATP phosphoribosyltransferase [Salsipaludibacter albus]
MLRVALPHKGTLSDASIDMLREAGYRQRRDRRDLVQVDPDLDVEFFYLRPRDIATYVGTGALDAGITGRDLLLDSEAAAHEVLPLGFGRSTFRYAARPGTVEGVADLDGRRIATSYVGLVRSNLAANDIDAELIHLDGSVETAPRLGVADVVADVVSTGTTLRQAGLEIVGEPILESEAVLIGSDGNGDNPAVDQLMRRLQGLIIARQWVMMDYDVRVEAVDEACALTPGIESPTVSPLHDKGWVAVRAMVERAHTNSIMDELYGLGARGILVTEILSCRL